MYSLCNMQVHTSLGGTDKDHIVWAVVPSVEIARLHACGVRTVYCTGSVYVHCLRLG